MTYAVMMVLVFARLALVCGGRSNCPWEALCSRPWEPRQAGLHEHLTLDGGSETLKTLPMDPQIMGPEGHPRVVPPTSPECPKFLPPSWNLVPCFFFLWFYKLPQTFPVNSFLFFSMILGFWKNCSENRVPIHHLTAFPRHISPLSNIFL